MSALARTSLGPACAELLRWLEEHAVTQSDGRRVVWHGSAEIARLTDKAPGTLTQQIGQLRLTGHVIGSRRGHIELAPDGPVTPARTTEPGGLADVISTLAGLANEYPDYREGLAAAIATISRVPRTEPRTASATAVHGCSEEVEEELPSSSHRAETPRIANTAFAIRSALAPLVELERRTNPRAQVPATIAQELSELVTVDELQRAIANVQPMFERGEIKTGIGLIVSHARQNNMELFRTGPPPPSSPSSAAEAPSPPPLSEPIEQVDIADPDIELFLQLPPAEADTYREAALASSGAFRPILEEHPAALTGAAAELWSRTVSSAGGSRDSV